MVPPQHPPPRRKWTMTLDELKPVELQVIRAVRAIRFGTVEVQVHDAQAVQIQSSERQRLDRPESSSPFA